MTLKRNNYHGYDGTFADFLEYFLGRLGPLTREQAKIVCDKLWDELMGECERPWSKEENSKPAIVDAPLPTINPKSGPNPNAEDESPESPEFRADSAGRLIDRRGKLVQQKGRASELKIPLDIGFPPQKPNKQGNQN